MDTIYNFCKHQTAFGNGLYTKGVPNRLEIAFDKWNRQQSLFATDKGKKFLEENCTYNLVGQPYSQTWTCADYYGKFQVFKTL